MKNKALILAGICIVATSVSPCRANELKNYYETQKAELLKNFKAPAIGSMVTIKLVGGMTRTGKLVALNPDSVTLELPVGPITYKKKLLNNATRRKLFAEDYANQVAIQRTLELKAKKYGTSRKQAEMHTARLSVKADLDKDRKVEKIEGKHNPNSNNDNVRITRKATESQTYKLDITLSNPTPNTDTYQLEWYFMSRGVNGKSSSVMCEKGSKEFTIEGRKRIKHTVTSKTLTNGSSKQSGGNDRGDRNTPKARASGSVYTGYVVLVRHGDKILAKASNNNSFLKEDWLEKLKAPPVAAASYVDLSGSKKPGKKKRGKKKKKE